MADIASLEKVMEEIRDVLKKGTGDGGPSEAKAGKPKTIGEFMQKQFAKGEGEGFGIQKGIGNKLGGLAELSGKGAAIGGTFGAIAAPAAALAMELAKLPGQIRDFTNGLHESNRALANFSPAMAQVFAASDWQDAMRKMAKGEAQADSAGSLADSRARMEDAFAPFDNAAANVQNEAMALISEILASILEELAPAADIVEEIATDIRAVKDWWVGGEAKRDLTQDSYDSQMDKIIEGERRKIEERRNPVRQPAVTPGPRGAAGGGF